MLEGLASHLCVSEVTGFGFCKLIRVYREPSDKFEGSAGCSKNQELLRTQNRSNQKLSRAKEAHIMIKRLIGR